MRIGAKRVCLRSVLAPCSKQLEISQSSRDRENRAGGSKPQNIEQLGLGIALPRIIRGDDLRFLRSGIRVARCVRFSGNQRGHVVLPAIGQSHTQDRIRAYLFPQSAALDRFHRCRTTALADPSAGGAALSPQEAVWKTDRLAKILGALPRTSIILPSVCVN